MNSILSLLLCLVMALSGAYMTEDTAANTSRVTTISDVVFTIDGVEYPIDASAMIGAKSENGEGVIAFEMLSGDQTLFPVQAKVSADGVGVLLGQSTTNYTFTDDLLSSVMTYEGGLPAEVDAFFAGYSDLLSQVAQLSYQNMGKSSALNSEENLKLYEYVLSVANDVQTVPGTVEVDGTAVETEKLYFTLDTNDCIDVIDHALEMVAPDLIGTMLDMVAPIAATEGVEIPDADSLGALISAIAASEGTEIPADAIVVNYEQNLTPDMQGTIVMEILANDGETSAALPVTIDCYGPESYAISSGMVAPEAGLDMTIEGVVEGNMMQLAVFYVLDDEYMPLEYGMNMTMQFNDDGSYTTETMVSENLGDGVTVTIGQLAKVDAEMNSVSDVSIEAFVSEEAAEMPISFTLSCRIENTAGEFEDRISDAKVTEINTEEEIGNATGLMLAAVGLSGDVEKLMNNESIVAVVDAVNALVPEESTEEYYEEYDGSEDPEDLPFTVPVFGYLPEGYSVDENSESAYTSDYYASYNVSIYDDNYNMISLSMSCYDEDTETSTYLLNADNSISDIDSTVLNVQTSEGVIDIYWNEIGISMNLYTFDSDLDLDTMFEIIKGISFEMKAE